MSKPSFCLLIDELLASWRVQGNDVPVKNRRMAARASLEQAIEQLAAPAITETALEQYKECCGPELESPLERLRFFCSLAMAGRTGQNWLDVEPFFDDLEKQLAAPVDLLRRLLDDHQKMEPHHHDMCQLCRDTQAAIDGAMPKPTIMPGQSYLMTDA